MKQEILNTIKKLGGSGVSFVELQNNIENFKGEFSFVVPDNENLILWPCISKDAADALSALLSSKEIKIMPTTMLVYLADGGTCTLPIAKSLRKYKKPHWLPSVFSLN